jgi:hypothetical protein
MKPFLAMCAGFAVSFVTALYIGLLLRHLLSSTSSSAPFFEPEFAGMMTLATVWYVVAHRFSKHL